MASHHHYHPYPTAAATNPTTPISTICCCYSCHPTPSPYPHPPPPPPNPHSTPPYTHYPPPQPHFCSSHLTPPPPSLTQCQCEPIHQNYHHFQEFNHQVTNKVTDQQTHRIVTSLLRRIAALESSLRRSSSSSPSVSHRSRQTLRDAAARTIQTHFRAFLARRSRTLRQLKQLASIKTTLYVLKSSVSGKIHFDTRAVSHRAKDLLVKLDSIKGDDPLIRDGKRSISNELTRFMKVINGVSIFSSRIVKNVRGGNKTRVFSSDRKIEFDTNFNEAIDKFVAPVRESEEEEEEEEEKEEDHQKPRFYDTGKSGFLRNRGGGLARSHGGVKPKQKKSVTFAENGNAYSVFNSTPEPASMGNVNEQDSFDTEIELMKNLSKKVEKLGVAAKACEVEEEEDGGSSGSSDNEMDPNYISRKDGYYERDVRDHDNDDDHENEGFLFSAPLPVKMEARAADINKKKGVKIVDS